MKKGYLGSNVVELETLEILTAPEERESVLGGSESLQSGGDEQ